VRALILRWAVILIAVFLVAWGHVHQADSPDPLHPAHVPHVRPVHNRDQRRTVCAGRLAGAEHAGGRILGHGRGCGCYQRSGLGRTPAHGREDRVGLR
jgi:hypothetical protein